MMNFLLRLYLMFYSCFLFLLHNIWGNISYFFSEFSKLWLLLWEFYVTSPLLFHTVPIFYCY